MNRPWKLEVDPAGNLWVSDTRNDRLLYFINPGTKANGAAADGLVAPTALAVSPCGDLWVVKSNNVAGGKSRQSFPARSRFVAQRRPHWNEEVQSQRKQSLQSLGGRSDGERGFEEPEEAELFPHSAE